MGILLLWFSRGLSTCALLLEETGQLINRPRNAVARIHQVWMKSLGSYVQPHPQGFSPYPKRTVGVFLGWFGTIDASPGCSVMWKTDVQFQKTRSFLFYFCVVKVCYKDVIGLLPCLRVKASICPFMASETFSSRWSLLPVLRFCERRESKSRRSPEVSSSSFLVLEPIWFISRWKLVFVLCEWSGFLVSVKLVIPISPSLPLSDE